MKNIFTALRFSILFLVLFLVGNGVLGQISASNYFVTNYTNSGRSDRFEIGDFNGDGKPDIVATSFTSPAASVIVMINDGLGGFSTSTVYNTGTSQPSDVAIGDVNNDGKLDIVVAHTGGSNLYLLYGDGTGIFTSGGNIIGYISTNVPTAVELADMNNDGWLDIITTHSSGNALRVQLQTLGGGFSGTFQSQITGLNNAEALKIADFNSDGKLDVVMTKNSPSEVKVYFGDALGGLSLNNTLSLLSFAQDIKVADIDADGLLDIAVDINGNTNLSVFYGLLGNLFEARQDIPTGVAINKGVDIADLDGDGKLDLIGSSSNQISVLLGNGSRTFGAGILISTGGSSNQIINTADFNADGKVDIAVSRLSSPNIGVLLYQDNYYTLGNAIWNVNSNNWSKDGTTGCNCNPASSGTHITIRSGHTLTINVPNINVNSIQVNQGAILDFDTSTGHTIGSLTTDAPAGVRTIQSSNGVLPTVAVANNAFLDNIGAVVEFRGTTYTILANFSGKNYQNVLINGTGVKTLTAANFTCRDLTISGGTLNGAATFPFFLNIKGSLQVDASAAFNSAGHRSINLDNSLTINGTGTISLLGSNAFNFTAGVPFISAVTISIPITTPVTFPGTVTVAAGKTVTNNARISIIGTLDGTDAASTWIQGTNSTLNYSDATLPMQTGVLDASTNINTVNYNLAGTQSIKQPSTDTYHHLTISGTNTKTLSGTGIIYKINGDLRVLTSTTLDMGSGGLILYGNLNQATDGGTISGPNPVRFDGSSNSVIRHSTGLTLSYVIMQKTGGFTVEIQTPLTITNNFGFIAFINTKLTSSAPANKLILASTCNAAIASASSTAYITAPVVRQTSTALSNYTLPIGDMTRYAPIKMDFPASLTNGTEVTYSATPPTGIVGTGITRRSNLEYWTIKNNEGGNSSYGNTTIYSLNLLQSGITAGQEASLRVAQKNTNWDAVSANSGNNTPFSNATTTIDISVPAGTSREITFGTSAILPTNPLLLSSTYYSVAGSVDWNLASSWTLGNCGTGAIPATPPTASDDVVICNGSTVTLSAASFCNNLTVNGGGTLQLSDKDITVDGTTTINATGAIRDNNDIGINTFNTISNDGDLIASTTANIFHFNGNITNTGTFDLGSTPQIYFDNTLSITLNGGTMKFTGNGLSGDYHIPNSTTTVTVANGILGGTVDLSGSTFNVAGSLINNYTDGFLLVSTISGGGTFTNNAYVKAGNAPTVTFFNNSTGSTFEYLYNSNVRIVPYHNIVFSNPNSSFSASLIGTIIVNGNFEMSHPNARLDASGFNIDLKGNWEVQNNLNFNAGTGTVTFSETTPIAVLQTITGATTFNNLTIANTMDVTLQASTPVTVSNTLTLTSGKLVLGANELSLNNSTTYTNQLTGGTASSYIVTDGTSKFTRQNVTGPATFPIGTASDYTPISFTNTDAFGSVSVSVRDGSAITQTPKVNLIWNIANSGAGNPVVQFDWIAPNNESSPLPSTAQVHQNSTSWTPIAPTTYTAGTQTATATILAGTGTTTRDFAFFTPSVIPTTNLGLWLKADAGVIGGSQVSSWQDQSGNNRHAVQGTGGLQPAFIASEPVINNQPVLRFDGIDDALPVSNGGGTFMVGSNYTVFVVGARNDSDDNNFIGGTSIATNQNFHFGFSNDNIFKQGQYGNDLEPNIACFVNAGKVFGVFSASLDMSVGKEIKYNGNSLAKSTNLIPLSANPGMTIGDFTSFNPSLNGDIAEIIIYSRTLTPAEMTQVESYLLTKYNIPLAPLSPTIASTISASATPTSASITTSGGNGSERIVVARQMNPVSFSPLITNTVLTPNSIFGTGADLCSGNYIVYEGAPTTFNLTGLTPNTTYHLQVFDYNGIGTNRSYTVGGVFNFTTPPITQPVGNRGMYFDGVDDFVHVNATPFATNFSIGFWIKTTQTDYASFAGYTLSKQWHNGYALIDADGASGTASDWGVSLGGGKILFGLGKPSVDYTAEGSINVSDNKWHYITVTRTFGGTLEIYVDGNKDTGVIIRDHMLNPYLTVITNNIDTNRFRFGQTTSGGSTPFLGQLDEIRMFTSVRTPSEIQVDMASTIPNGAVGYWDFEDDALVMNPQVAANSGSAGAAANGTLGSSGTVDPNDPFWALRTTNILDDGLIGSLRWAITEANTDADKDYIDFTIDNIIPSLHTIILASPLDLSKPAFVDGYSALGSTSTVLNIDIDGGGNDIFNLNSNNSTLQGLILRNGASAVNVNASNNGNKISQNSIYNNTNGIELNSTGNTGQPAPSIDVAHPIFARGTCMSCPDGSVVELFENVTNTPIEGKIYRGSGIVQNGKWLVIATPSMTVNNYLTATITTPTNNTSSFSIPQQITAYTAQTTPDGNRGMYFDGVDDYVQVADNPSLNPTATITVEAWIKPSKINPGTPYNNIVSKEAASAGYALRIGQGGLVDFGLFTGGLSRTATTATVLVSPNQWTHVAGVYDGTNVMVYVNGFLEKSVPYPSSSITQSTAVLNIGNSVILPANRHFEGQIDQVRIFASDRSQFQIRADMASSTPNGAVAYWDFEEGTGQTVDDLSVNSNIGTLGSSGTAEPSDPLWALRVKNTNDSGIESLRDVIIDANTLAGKNYIDFSIQQADPLLASTITLLSDLPTITESTLIDGYSAFGSAANTTVFPANMDTKLRVEIKGGDPTSSTALLPVTGSDVTIKGLAINDFSYSGIALAGKAAISLNGNNGIVQGCFLGTNYEGLATSMTAVGACYGIRITGGTTQLVGGQNPADRNLLTGFVLGSGVYSLYAPSTNILTVQGNYIGTLIDKSEPSSNKNMRAIDVVVFGGSDGSLNYIGGSLVREGNLIAYNTSGGTGAITASYFAGNPNSPARILAGDNRNNIAYCNTNKFIYNFPPPSFSVVVDKPIITSVSISQVNGTALPNATVDVYIDNTPCAGTPNQGRDYKGTVTADAGGVWTLTTTFVVGDNVTALQSTTDNTSDFSDAYFFAGTFYSRDGFAADWSDNNSWTLSSTHVGVAAPTAPSVGAVAVIKNGHTITTTSAISPSSITLAGTLDLSNIAHTLTTTDIVDSGGMGRLKIGSSLSATSIATVPASSSFFTTPSNVVEFYGGAYSTIPIRDYPSIEVSGTDTKETINLSGTLNIYGNLTLNAGTNLRLRLLPILTLPTDGVVFTASNTHTISMDNGTELEVNRLIIDENTLATGVGFTTMQLREQIRIASGKTFTNNIKSFNVQDPASFGTTGVFINQDVLYYFSSSPITATAVNFDFTTHTTNTVAYYSAINPVPTTYRDLIFDNNTSGARTLNGTINADYIEFRNSADLTLAAGAVLNQIDAARSFSMTGAGTLNFGTVGATVTIAGDLSAAGVGATINMSNGNPLVAGHILNLNGTNNNLSDLMTGTNLYATVVYGKNGNQNVFSSTEYQILEIAGSGIKTLQGLTATTVNNQLKLTAGTLDIPSTLSPLIIGQSAVIINGSGFSTLTDFTIANCITTSGGVLTKEFTSPLTNYLFPIGESGKYAPVIANMTSYTGGGTASLTLKPITGFQPNLLNTTKALNKYWQTYTNNITSITGGALKFYYDDTEVNGIETNYLDGYYNGSAWNLGNTTNVDETTNEISFSGLTDWNNKAWTAGEIGAFAAPIITVSTANLTAFASCGGTAEQSYTVSGTNLSANIIVTPPTGFQISLTSGTGFGNLINLTPVFGNVPSTTIFVRQFAPAMAGNITHTSIGATTQNVAIPIGIDNQAPTLTALQNFTRNADQANCYYTNQNTNLTQRIPNGTASDNCGVASYRYILSGATIADISLLNDVQFNIGVTTVSWTATDTNGNTSSSSQFTVTVTDAQNPIIQAPQNITRTTNLYGCTSTRDSLNIGTPTASDNCLFRIFNDAPAEFPIGQTIVIWTAVDSAGNSATANQTVTITEQYYVAPSDSLILVQIYNQMGGVSWTYQWDFNTPISTWRGISVRCGRVASIDLSNNNLTGVLPLSVLNLARRTENDFALNIGGNRLNFESAENFVDQINNFTYSPQAKIYLPRTETIRQTESITFTSQTEGNFNKYQWYKNQTPIVGATGWNYTITNALPSDAGIYVCKATNTVATQLTLERNPITLEVEGFVNSIDSLALVQIFLETGGTTSWTENWDLTQPVATWEGVTLSGTKIKELDLSSRNMMGTLPNVFDEDFFSELRYLSFFDNNLSGQIPVSIGDITTLIYLDLDKNNFEGSVPASFGNLINLQTLWLSRNNLTDLPTEIGNLINLKTLYLNDNKFTQLPESIGNLTELLVLNVSDNQLSSLPNSITNLRKLIQFYANRNYIAAIPANIQNLANLTVFEINTNNLTTLPNGFLQLTSLSSFRVAENKLEFDDLLPYSNQTYSTFDYSPQAPINEEKEILAVLNSSISFSIQTLGNGNRYQWFRNGTSVATTQNFTINRVGNNNVGIYTAQITNPSLPKLTLQRRSITLNVECQAALNFEIKQPTQTVFCENQPFGLKLEINDQITNAQQIRWRKDGIILAFANEKSYTITTAGTYTAEVLTTDGCTVLSNNVEITVLSQPEISIDLSNVNNEKILTSTLNSQENVTYQWLKDGNPIEDAFENTYKPTQKGEYSLLVLTESGCSSISQTIIFTADDITGIEEPKEFRNLEIFPNPNKGNFFIDFGTSTPNGKPNFMLIDAMGRKIILKTEPISSTRYKVITNKLAGGMYYLQIQTKDGLAFRKFVIEE